MPVRKTESRLPANFQADDLGEAVTAVDGRCVLISFVTSPIVVGRENTYVLFVTDSALATAAQSFEWAFAENDGAPDFYTTQHGEITYRPQSTGKLTLITRVLSTGNVEQASLTIEQEIILTSAEVETLISTSRNEPGPGITNPEVVRELVNEHSRYYQNVALQVPESGDGFKRFVFRFALEGALNRTPAQRRQHFDELSASLDGKGNDFAALTAEAVGICGIRLALLAMVVPKIPGNPATFIDWTELPEPSDQRTFADEQLRKKLAMLDEKTRVDLFNLARFPKSNITQCGRILETLRDRYFTSTTFETVLSGMSGMRALLLARHYREGPLVKS